MKKILVASDFSACAGNALEYALELAKTLGFDITVIHAIGSTEGIGNSTYNAIYIQDYYDKKRLALSTWAMAISNKEAYAGVPVDSVCEVGSVSAVIAKYLEKNPVEILVMGTMGSTGISGLFGSNTNSMVEKTKTPMLVVPLGSKFSSNPVITLATDFSTKLSPEDVNALKELVESCKLPKLNVLNVVETKTWQTNEAGEAALKELISNTQLEFNYVQENSTIDGIMNFVTASQTDILCLVKHHHNILYRVFSRSTVNQLNNKAVKAVLVLHE